MKRGRPTLWREWVGKSGEDGTPTGGRTSSRLMVLTTRPVVHSVGVQGRFLRLPKLRMILSLGTLATTSTGTMLPRIGMRLSGPVLACALSLVGTALPSIASADACTCGSWDELVDDAPVSEATMGDAAVSQPVDVISSHEVIVASAPEAPEKVLWCESSDDPRCAPIQGTTPAPELTMPSPGNLVPPQTPRAEMFPTSRRTANVGLAASVGARFELERPPQG